MFDLLDDLLMQHEIDSSPTLSATMALFDIEINALLSGDTQTELQANLLGSPTEAEIAEAEAADARFWGT